MVILAWHATGWDLVQGNRGVRPLLGNVDLAEHCGGVQGVVVLVLGSSFSICPGFGDHSDFFSAIFFDSVHLELYGVW